MWDDNAYFSSCFTLSLSMGGQSINTDIICGWVDKIRFEKLKKKTKIWRKRENTVDGYCCVSMRHRYKRHIKPKTRTHTSYSLKHSRRVVLFLNNLAGIDLNLDASGFFIFLIFSFIETEVHRFCNNGNNKNK